LLDSAAKQLIRDNRTDKEYIEKYVSNIDEFKKFIEQVDIQEALSYSSVNPQKFDKFISLIKDPAKNIAFIYNIDSRGDKAVNDLKAAANIMLLTGRIGKENNGIIILRDHNNSAGLGSMGADTDYLPGYVGFNQDEEISRISELWKTDLKGIFKPADIIRKLRKGEIKGILLFGEDPLNIYGNEIFFNGVEFMAVSDAWHNSTTVEADVLLPAASYIEEEGSYTRCDNVVQEKAKISNGIHHYENWMLISDIASRFAEGFSFISRSEVVDEINRVHRFFKYNEAEKGWMRGYFDNEFKKAQLSCHPRDMSTYSPAKYILHYPENYYFSSIKNKIA
jgi:predicted molibdopterin-dependent oxidoreductase YjgC